VSGRYVSVLLKSRVDVGGTYADEELNGTADGVRYKSTGGTKCAMQILGLPKVADDSF